MDEGLTIAGAFLMAGVSYVIGTWWKIVDEVAVSISKSFYEELKIRTFADRGLDLSKCTVALHASVQKMRKDGVNPMPRGAYVHLGA